MKFYYKLVIYVSLIFRVRKVTASVEKSSPAGEGTPLKRLYKYSASNSTIYHCVYGEYILGVHHLQYRLC